MKKLSIVLLCTLFTICSFGQEFIGIKIDGDLKTVLNKFVTKGFKIKYSSVPNVTTATGYYSGTLFEVNIVSTPITKKVWKFAVYLPKKYDWTTLKSEYTSYRSSLIEKYGLPNSSYSGFTTPYYEGDGYEITGVSVNKCNYSTYWDNMSIEISQFQQIRITYENSVNADLYELEKNNINQNIF
jgi:hypothetical protein